MEQGLAQQRMWFTSSPTIEAGSDSSILGVEAESSVRDLCEILVDMVITGEEIDKAIDKEHAKYQ